MPPLNKPKAAAKPASNKVAESAGEYVYPTVELRKAWGEHAITAEGAKKLLGWESEDDYAIRVKEENPSIKGTPSYGNDYDFTDIMGKNIRCDNNDRNRPFDENHAKKLAQDILNREWAGPTTMPGETVNGETVVISRMGKVKSGQHRMIGLIFANQLWEKDKALWESKWPTPPVLETVLVYGVSDADKVSGTMDNVKPRTLADTLYTSSELFREETNRKKRSELAKMLDAAVDTLWKRTGQAEIGGLVSHYQTHAASRDFLERHNKLIECVEVIAKLNKDNGIKLPTDMANVGPCATLLYLMGSSKSDINDYRNSAAGDTERRMPDESTLNWDNWDEANNYWDAMKGPKLAAIANYIKKLVDTEEGKGRMAEKTMVLVKGWLAWLQDGKPTEADVKLNYDPGKAGQYVLMDKDTCGGIDVGEKQSKPEPWDNPADVQARAEQEKQNGLNKLRGTVPTAPQAAAAKTLTGKPKDKETMREALDRWEEKYKGRLLIFKATSGFNLYGEGARTASVALKLPTKVGPEQLQVLSIAKENLEASFSKLGQANLKPIIVDSVGNEIDIATLTAKPKANENGKPPAAPAPAKPALRPGSKIPAKPMPAAAAKPSPKKPAPVAAKKK